jgi:hypothetical protein
MEEWLDEFIEEFKREMPKFTTATQAGTDYCKHDVESAKEFVKKINEIANSKEQKLSGDLTNGYTYITTDPVSDWVHGQYKELIENLIKTPLKLGNYEIEETEKGTNFMWTKNNPQLAYNSRFVIDRVIFNDPATIVFWKDGSKTIVKADNEIYDPEKGLAMAIAKKAYGNQGNYFNNIKKWTGDTNKADPKSDPDVIDFVNEALNLLSHYNVKGQTKNDLIEDARMALKFIIAANHIWGCRYRASVAMELALAETGLCDALTDADRRKNTVMFAMEKAVYYLNNFLGE